MNLARFYRDGELSEIRISSSEEVVSEVNNLFAAEQLAEDAIRDMIRTQNRNQYSHVDELRLDFNRIFRKRELLGRTKLKGYQFSDSAQFEGRFSVDTILSIKNEQRYLSACFSDYVILKPRWSFFHKNEEPYLFASLRNGCFYLLNASDLPPAYPLMHSFKNVIAWIPKKIFSKTSTK